MERQPSIECVCHSYVLKNALYSQQEIIFLAWEMAHWVKCLLCKLEDPSSNPQHPAIKYNGMCHNPGLVAVVVVGGRSLNLAGQQI